MENQFRRASELMPDERRVAEILGLTLDEYRQLSHSGIREIKHIDGSTLNYYMVISPLNPESILGKIKMDKYRKVQFPPDCFVRKDYPLEEVV